MDENTGLVQKIASVLYNKKARDIKALDVKGMTVLCDYLVIATGRSVNQVSALAKEVDDVMAENGIQLRRSEGINEGRWVVLDYATIIVHIFHMEERRYYHLERLWETGTNQIELPFDQTDED